MRENPYSGISYAANFIDAILMSLLLTLNLFYTFSSGFVVDFGHIYLCSVNNDFSDETFMISVKL